MQTKVSVKCIYHRNVQFIDCPFGSSYACRSVQEFFEETFFALNGNMLIHQQWTFKMQMYQFHYTFYDKSFMIRLKYLVKDRKLSIGQRKRGSPRLNSLEQGLKHRSLTVVGRCQAPGSSGRRQNVYYFLFKKLQKAKFLFTCSRKRDFEILYEMEFDFSGQFYKYIRVNFESLYYILSNTYSFTFKCLILTGRTLIN